MNGFVAAGLSLLTLLFSPILQADDLVGYGAVIYRCEGGSPVEFEVYKVAIGRQNFEESLLWSEEMVIKGAKAPDRFRVTHSTPLGAEFRVRVAGGGEARVGTITWQVPPSCASRFGIARFWLNFAQDARIRVVHDDGLCLGIPLVGLLNPKQRSLFTWSVPRKAIWEFVSDEAEFKLIGRGWSGSYPRLKECIDARRTYTLTHG